MYFHDLQSFWKAYPQFEITEEMRAASEHFPFCVSSYYASLIKKFDYSDPIFAQCVPNGKELLQPQWLTMDPLGENPYSIFPRLVHRYKNRALVICNSVCATLCRHCTRKRVSGCAPSQISETELEQIADYLRARPEISDLLVSGGDPLMLKKELLFLLLRSFADIPSLKVIRLCTRVPVTNPELVTDELVEEISEIRKKASSRTVFYLNTQFNHPAEVTEQSLAACEKWTDHGISVASQTVLMRGINNSAELLGELFMTLFENRIRPYYLFQCDLVQGVEHFRTDISEGLEIMKWLRANISGMAIPNFCLDPPGEGGKIELSPDYIVEKSATATRLINGGGDEFKYPAVTRQ